LGQENIARHHHVFGGGRNSTQAEKRRCRPFMHIAARAEIQILAMLDEGQIEGSRKFQTYSARLAA